MVKFYASLVALAAVVTLIALFSGCTKMFDYERWGLSHKDSDFFEKESFPSLGEEDELWGYVDWD